MFRDATYTERWPGVSRLCTKSRLPPTTRQGRARGRQRPRKWVGWDWLERDRLRMTPSHFAKECFATPPIQIDVPRVLDCETTFGFLQRPVRHLPRGVDEYQTGFFKNFCLPNRRALVVTHPVVGVRLAGRLTSHLWFLAGHCKVAIEPSRPAQGKSCVHDVPTVTRFK